MLAPASSSANSPLASRDGLAQWNGAPQARAVIRSVSDVDSSKAMGADTPYSYRMAAPDLDFTLFGRLFGRVEESGGIPERSRHCESQT